MKRALLHGLVAFGLGVAAVSAGAFASDPAPGPDGAVTLAEAPSLTDRYARPTTTCTAAVEKVADLLDRRERVLARRERTIDSREGQLRAAEVRLSERLDQLNTARQSIESNLEALTAAVDAATQEAATTLESMKPDAAAKVVAGLDPATAQRVLSRMQRTKRAKVLAALPPELAVSLTKLQIGATP